PVSSVSRSSAPRWSPAFCATARKAANRRSRSPRSALRSPDPETGQQTRERTIRSAPALFSAPYPGRASLAGHCVLHLGVEVETPFAALAAHTRFPGAAEGGPQIADPEAVDPHRARVQALRDPLGAYLVTGEQCGGEPVTGTVRHRYRL